MADLTGRKVLAVVSNRGVEQDELKVPVERLRAAGASVVVAAPEPGTVKTLLHDWDPGEEMQVDKALPDVSDGDYDLLLVPGGTLNADKLRLDPDATGIVRSFAQSGRPIAAICHGPWVLIEAEHVRDKTMTSYISVKTDAMNAGANWTDEAVVRGTEHGWTLITSRNPRDLDPFCAAIEEELARLA